MNTILKCSYDDLHLKSSCNYIIIVIKRVTQLHTEAVNLLPWFRYSQSLPALLFGCVLHGCISLALLVSSGMLTGGVNKLCHNLQSRLPAYR